MISEGSTAVSTCRRMELLLLVEPLQPSLVREVEGLVASDLASPIRVLAKAAVPPFSLAP